MLGLLALAAMLASFHANGAVSFATLFSTDCFLTAPAVAVVSASFCSSWSQHGAVLHSCHAVSEYAASLLRRSVVAALPALVSVPHLFCCTLVLATVPGHEPGHVLRLKGLQLQAAQTVVGCQFAMGCVVRVLAPGHWGQYNMQLHAMVMLWCV
jgi:hypothetical protein